MWIVPILIAVWFVLRPLLPENFQGPKPTPVEAVPTYPADCVVSDEKEHMISDLMLSWNDSSLDHFAPFAPENPDCEYIAVLNPPGNCAVHNVTNSTYNHDPFALCAEKCLYNDGCSGFVVSSDNTTCLYLSFLTTVDGEKRAYMEHALDNGEWTGFRKKLRLSHHIEAVCSYDQSERSCRRNALCSWGTRVRSIFANCPLGKNACKKWCSRSSCTPRCNRWNRNRKMCEFKLRCRFVEDSRKCVERDDRSGKKKRR